MEAPLAGGGERAGSLKIEKDSGGMAEDSRQRKQHVLRAWGQRQHTVK